MRTFSLLALLLLLGPVLRGSAQDLSIERLVALTALPDGHSADMVDWSFQPPTKQTSDEPLTWGWPAEYSADSTGTLPLQVSLRPAAHGYDVVLYIQRLPLYNHLRRELEKRKLTPLPVTCLGAGCLGFRFDTPACTVAFYEGKPGDYRYMVVLQPKTGRPPQPAAASKRTPTEAPPAERTPTATNLLVEPDTLR